MFTKMREKALQNTPYFFVAVWFVLKILKMAYRKFTTTDAAVK
jgi:hypothetical protein